MIEAYKKELALALEEYNKSIDDLCKIQGNILEQTYPDNPIEHKTYNETRKNNHIQLALAIEIGKITKKYEVRVAIARAEFEATLANAK